MHLIVACTVSIHVNAIHFKHKYIKHSYKILLTVNNYWKAFHLKSFREFLLHLWVPLRRTHSEVFLNFFSQNSQENTCTRVSFFDKVEGLRPATLLKKRLGYKCFLVDLDTCEFCEILRTTFLQNTSSACFWLLFFPWIWTCNVL